MRNTTLLSLIVAATISFGVTNAAIQPSQLERAIADVKRAYQASLSQMKKMETLASKPYSVAMSVINKIINSPEFKAKMNASIEPQFNSMTQYGTEFEGVHQSTQITDFVSTTETIHPFMAKLYTFVANKEYCQALWQKLTNYKPQEESSPDDNKADSSENSESSDYSPEQSPESSYTTENSE